MEFLAPRADTSCTDGKLWYVCTIGSFTGCCSSDPCTDGICPDDDSDSTTKKRTASTTSKSTSTTLSTTMTTTSAASKENTSTTTSDATSIVSLTSIISATSTATASPVTSAASRSSNAGMIGGILGGVIGALLLGLLIFCGIRRRGAKIKVTLHHSVSTESLRARDLPNKRGLSAAEAEAEASESQPLTGSTRSLPTLHPSTSSIVPTTISSLNTDGTHEQTSVPSTIPSLTLSTNTHTPTPTGTNTSTSTGAKHPLPPLIIPFKPPPHSIPHPLTPRAATYVPELSDTGFRRARVELPSSPSSELINQRRFTARYRHNPSPSASANASTPRSAMLPTSEADAGINLISRYTARKVITRDGIIMGANLDRISSIDEESPTPPSTSTSTSTSTPTPTSTSMGSAGVKGSAKVRFKGNGKGRTGLFCAHGKRTIKNGEEHVMSFMNYAPTTGIEMGERGEKGVDGQKTHTATGTDTQTPPDSALSKGRSGSSAGSGFYGLEGARVSAVSEVLPAYESGDFFGKDGLGWKKS